MKHSMIGKLTKDIYVANGRYPIDSGEVYVKETIDEMFTLRYLKGTKLYRQDEGKHFAWYLKDGDGGWTEFYPIDDYLNGRKSHEILSNLEIVKDNRIR